MTSPGNFAGSYGASSLPWHCPHLWWRQHIPSRGSVSKVILFPWSLSQNWYQKQRGSSAPPVAAPEHASWVRPGQPTWALRKRELPLSPTFDTEHLIIAAPPCQSHMQPDSHKSATKSVTIKTVQSILKHYNGNRFCYFFLGWAKISKW